MNISGSRLLRSDAVQIFCDVLGMNPTNLDELMKACEQYNPRYTGGKDLVRYELEQDDQKWPANVRHATMNLANFFNMCRGETPLVGDYDLIIALGGARRSPLHRACYAAMAVEDNRASTDWIAVAGSTRPLRDDEKGQDYARDAVDEAGLCDGATTTVKKRFTDLKMITVRHDNPKSGNDGVIDATMDALSSEIAKYDHPLRVAAVTTRIYVVGLHLDMARAAKRHGWGPFLAAGHDSDPEMRFKRSLSTYLSECLTTVRKAAIAAAAGC